MAEYYFKDYSEYHEGSISILSDNSVKANLPRNVSAVIGFKIPLSAIPDYQNAKFSFEPPAILNFNFRLTAGYLDEYAGFADGFPSHYEAYLETSYGIVPCIEVKNVATSVGYKSLTFNVPPLVVTYPSGKKIYLGPDQVQAVYLGDREVSSVFLGTEEV